MVHWTSKPQWETIKKAVLKRDNFCCVACGKSNKQIKLLIHHKDMKDIGSDTGSFERKNNRINNLVTMCNSCHLKLHSEEIGRFPRLTNREFEFRQTLISDCWEDNKAELTMTEMANIFRMSLGQFFKIVKSKK